MLKPKPIGAWWTLDQVRAHFRARGDQMDLVTLARTLDAHKVGFRNLPQFGNASVVMVGASLSFEEGMRAMVFSSADILAALPAPPPTIETAPIVTSTHDEALIAAPVVATIAVEAVPDAAPVTALAVEPEELETATTASVVVDATPSAPDETVKAAHTPRRKPSKVPFGDLVAFVHTLIGVVNNREDVDALIDKRFGYVPRPVRAEARRAAGFAGTTGPKPKG